MLAFQRPNQIGRVLRPLDRVLGEQPANDLAGVLGELLQIRRFLNVVQDDFLVGSALEGHYSGQDLVGDDAEAVEIGALVRRSFGSQVCRRA